MVPNNKAINGSVFFTINPITKIGTINNHGVMLNDCSIEVKIPLIFADPCTSRFAPIMEKTIKVITNVGTVVSIIYLIYVNRSVPAMAAANVVVSDRGDNLSD